jgi:hypothetical protein
LLHSFFFYPVHPVHPVNLLLSGDEDELAELCTILHQLMRAARFRERQRAVNDGANHSALDELHGL